MGFPVPVDVCPVIIDIVATVVLFFNGLLLSAVYAHWRCNQPQWSHWLLQRHFPCDWTL